MCVKEHKMNEGEESKKENENEKFQNSRGANNNNKNLILLSHFRRRFFFLSSFHILCYVYIILNNCHTAIIIITINK